MKLRSLMAALAVVCAGMGYAKAENLVIGVGTDAAYTPFYLALERGIFKKRGLDVTFLKFSNGGDAVDAVVAGQAQFAGAAEQTTMIRMARGADLRPMVIYEESGSYIKLVTKPDIKEVKQIKSFGIAKGSVSEYSANLSLTKFGVDPATVKMVPAGPPELPALLSRGDIDGYFAWEPWPSLGVKQGGKVLMTSGDVGYAYTMWLTSSGAWLDKNKETAKNVIAALKEVNAQIAAEPDKAAQDFQNITKQPASDTAGFIKTTKWDVRPFSDRDYVSFDKIVDFMVAQKISATKVDFRTAMQKGKVE